jgi:hypothetical protein
MIATKEGSGCTLKWIYRCGIIGLCIVLWLGLWRVSICFEKSAEEAPYRDSFSFPQLLQGTDVYLWSLSAESDGACLVLQNIGEKTISCVEIVFLSYGQKLVFCASEILPGQRVSVTEENDATVLGECKFVCSEFKVS